MEMWSGSCPGRCTPGTLRVDDWVRLGDELDFMDYKNQILPLFESNHDSSVIYLVV